MTEDTTSTITTKAKFLCNICDCVSIGTRGDPITQLVFEKFTHANIYSERVATKKSLPGTLQIKGDGKKNRYVVNMITQFYPGAPKYPNDNIMKRLEWFNMCLDKLLDINDAESVAFPQELGTYEPIDYQERYLNALDDFKKKYYLKHRQVVKMFTYQDQELLFSSDKSQVTYAEPIKMVRLSDLDVLEPTKPKINVIKHVKISELFYLGGTKLSFGQERSSFPQSPPVLAQPLPPAPHVEKEDVVISKTKAVVNHLADVEGSDEEEKPKKVKVKVGLKKVTPVVPVVVTSTPSAQLALFSKTDVKPVVIYEKNPTWTRKISELIDEIDPSWDPIFKDPKIMGLLAQLDIDFEKEMSTFGDHIEILPAPQTNIFNAFKHTKFPIKALVLGQDPYFSNLNEAHGLSFSVPDGVKVPPSLDNIFKELSTDVPGFKIPKSGNLTKWASQGVLMLNASLTVRYQQKEGHMKLWKAFTDAIIQLISEKSETPVAFILWGAFAKGKKALIVQQSKHLVIEGTHPSPLGANQGGFFGGKYFSKTNEFIVKHNIKPIDWLL